MSSDENKIEQSILISPSINHKWRLWHYDCNDFPQHEKKSCRKKDCKFCVNFYFPIIKFICSMNWKF